MNHSSLKGMISLKNWAAVHALEDLGELVLSRVGQLVHGRTAGLLNAAPVEVITNLKMQS